VDDDVRFFLGLALFFLVFISASAIAISLDERDDNRTDIRIAEIGADVCKTAPDPAECIVTIGSQRTGR
jgi:hypothetical protein